MIDYEQRLDYRPVPFDSWTFILSSSLLWCACYYIVVYFLPEKNQEFCCRLLTFWHGVWSTLGGISQCVQPASPFKHPEWRTTDHQKLLMVFSLGYFIYDLVWCMIYQRSARLMIVHHVISVLALYRMLGKVNSGAQATCALGTMEITNPLLQARWFLRSEGYYPSTMHTAVEMAFIGVFWFVRILLGTYLFMVIMHEDCNDWDFKAFTFMMYILSWVFMVNIVIFAVQRYFNPKFELECFTPKGS